MPFTFDGSGALAKLQRLQDNMPKAVEAMGIVYLAAAQRRITSGGSGWAPWSKDYANYIARTHQHQMLWDTGTLVRSLSVGGQDNIFQPNGNSITIGSNVAYAAAQEFGYGPRDLPARPYLIMDDADTKATALNAVRKRMLQGIT